MKQNFEVLHQSGVYRRYHTQVVNITKIKFGDESEKRVKFTYECGNAYERYNVSIFDGYEWKHFAGIYDLGIVPDTSMYATDESKQKERASKLYNIAIDFTLNVIA